MTKREEVRKMIERSADEALLLHSARISDRQVSEVFRVNARYLAQAVAFHLCEEYRFLELSDIFEWKRERVRR